MFRSLSEYPHPFVAVCTVLAAVLVLWVLVKVIKFALWMLLIGILVVAGAATVWLLLT